MLQEHIKIVQDALERGDKLMVVLLGITGSGKTWMRNELLTAIDGKGYDMQVLNLDEYRREANGGAYPEGNAQHKRINDVVIPKYNKDLAESKAQLLLLDNMHIRFVPSWSAIVSKATSDGYGVFTISAPFSVHSLISQRAQHGVNDRIFFSMLHNWPGHRFCRFLHRYVPAPAVKDLVRPLRADPGTSSRCMKFGASGYVYCYNGYVGYIDDAIAARAVAAAHIMRDQGAEGLFMQRDGVLHATLIDARTVSKASVDLAVRVSDIIFDFIANKHRDMGIAPPPIECTGVNVTRDAATSNELWYMTVSEHSHSAWEALFVEALGGCCDPAVAASLLNRDGLHVTLGFRFSDIHGVSKAGQPKFPFVGDPDQSLTFMPKPQVALKQSAEESLDSSPLPRYFGSLMPTGEAIRTVSVASGVSATHLSNIKLFVEHPNVAMKPRFLPGTAKGASRFLLGARVVHERRRRVADEQIYLNNLQLQQTLPRGLTYVLSRGQDGCSVKLEAVVYPTSKFFGDEDIEDDVRVELTSNLAQKVSRDTILVETEKANGEMFSFTVVGYNSVERSHAVVLGSKNNKFLFDLCVHQQQQSWVADVEAQITAYMEHETIEGRSMIFTNLWVEMVRYFLCTKLIDIGASAKDLLDYLLQNGFTACGEFESFEHPHVVRFTDPAHRSVKFFALTACDDKGHSVHCSALEKLQQLDRLRAYGLETVSARILPRDTDFTTYRRSIWLAQEREGVVLAVASQGSGRMVMMKLKTIWYIYYRGFRERLKHVVMAKSSRAEALDETSVREALHRVVAAKLSIFAELGKQAQLSLFEEYQRRAALLAKRVCEHEKLHGREKLCSDLTEKYPNFIY